ncbi:hypothetical protein BT69DRAFT_862241 [Atractiella rhizophila]|nr:hypothetical protein BT69DRAFT_862241 [Atractiella rhizophila]
MSYFDEPIHGLLISVQTFYSSRAFTDRKPRLIIYVKNDELAKSEERLRNFKEETGANHVVTGLANWGRESGTYLRHIIINYNTTRESVEGHRRCDGISCPLGLATHTLFIQPHLSWERLAVTRYELLEDHTGFMTGTVWLRSDCGKDGRGNGEFPRMAQIYTMFREEPCPPTNQLATYSGQFFASRRRIRENKWSAYKELDDLLEAPAGHPIYQEGDWWKYHGEPGPTNPYLGHAVERSWPTIFNCIDPTMAERCFDSDWIARRRDCQCYDVDP